MGKTTRLTTEDFIKRSKLVHENRYDYSKVEYKNNRTKVCIICPEHGEFWQRPGDHMKGQGCSKCASQKRRERLSLKKEDFINKCNVLYHSFSRQKNSMLKNLMNVKRIILTCCIFHTKNMQFRHTT